MFVQEPNLPASKVRSVLIGERYMQALAEPLMKLGITPLPVADNDAVDSRLVGHCDLSVIHLGGNAFVAARSAMACLRPLEDMGALITEAAGKQGAVYPYDAGLCGFIHVKRFYHRADITDKALMDAVKRNNITPVKVSQGYAKCMVCPVGENAALCSDPGLAKALSASGVSVFFVPGGGIRLDGFDCGFIGGAAFMAAPDLIAFSGRLDRLPWWEDCKDFINRRKIDTLFLTGGECFDFGSALPVIED